MGNDLIMTDTENVEARTMIIEGDARGGMDTGGGNAAVLNERLGSLSMKVEEFRVEIREDISTLTSAIGNLNFVDQRVHDIEMVAIKELMRINHDYLTKRADLLASEVEAEKERRALNFRLAIGALATGMVMPILVALAVFALTR